MPFYGFLRGASYLILFGCIVSACTSKSSGGDGSLPAPVPSPLPTPQSITKAFNYSDLEKKSQALIFLKLKTAFPVSTVSTFILFFLTAHLRGLILGLN